MYKVLSDFFLLKRKEVLTTLTFVRIAFKKEIWLGVAYVIRYLMQKLLFIPSFYGRSERMDSIMDFDTIFRF